MLGSFSLWMNGLFKGTFENKVACSTSIKQVYPNAYSVTVIVQEKLEEGDLCPFCKHNKLHWQPTGDPCYCAATQRPPCGNCEKSELGCPGCLYVVGDLTDKELQENELPTAPTEVGKENWPPDGFYDGEPCVCTETCDEPCKGECGCQACSNSYSDYLSGPQ